MDVPVCLKLKAFPFGCLLVLSRAENIDLQYDDDDDDDADDTQRRIEMLLCLIFTIPLVLLLLATATHVTKRGRITNTQTLTHRAFSFIRFYKIENNSSAL